MSESLIVSDPPPLLSSIDEELVKLIVLSLTPWLAISRKRALPSVFGVFDVCPSWGNNLVVETKQSPLNVCLMEIRDVIGVVLVASII